MASAGGTTLKADTPRTSPHSAPNRDRFLVGAAILAGLSLFWWQFLHLWSIWTTDNLRSIGALVIPVSLALALHALRRDDFEAGGSWWGLVPLATALAGANLQYYGPPVLLVRGYAFDLLPFGVVLYLYASGMMIVLGSITAWRRASFALFLLLFVNPVPSFFNGLLDLPLQHLGAQAARSFATLLGVPLSGVNLDLMFFHGDLGMFIAPSCNGLHGAVAMGGLALVIGHLRGMRILRHVMFVAVALGLAYLLNLLRLCVLVLYYCLAHSFPALGGYAVGADYVIGATLFVSAAAFLFGAARVRSANEEQNRRSGRHDDRLRDF
jgi:exosortase J